MTTQSSIRRKVLIGADPEVFVRQSASGQFISAHGMPGTKQHPFTVEAGAIQVDGCALEFNINPADTKKEFLDNIASTMAALRRGLEDRIPGAELVPLPMAEFPKDYFENLPPEVKILGCEPDFNAYTLDINEMPTIEEPVRFAGGHIHVGFTSDADPFDMTHMVDCASIVQQLDHSVFLMSLLYDPDNRRRAAYGRPGSFRPKPYGVEYRVLSNKWLESRDLQGWVYDSTIVALEHLSNGVRIFEQPELQDAVNKSLKDDRYFMERDDHIDLYWQLVGQGFPMLPFKYERAPQH